MADEPVNVPQSGAPATDFRRQREDARRSLLRANTAVALVLVVVFALALAAVWLGWRATRLRTEAESNQHRAEHAEAQARSDLWRAYVSEARATRLGNTLERRAAVLDSLRRAAAIAPAPELRNEAVAALALPDCRVESSVALDPSVNVYAFEPALQRCALGLTNGDIVIRALADGRELSRLRQVDGGIPQEQMWVGNVEFSPDGNRLSVRYLGGALAIWDLASRRVVFRYNEDKHRNLTSGPRFSSDGRFVVTTVLAPRDGMGVFELETGREVAFFREFSSFRHASIRPGAPVFAVNTGTNLAVMNWETGGRIAELPFSGGIRRTAWSPDGSELAIVGTRLDVHIWSVTNWQRRVFSAHKGDVFNVVFDPTGTRMATSSEDGTSRIWNLDSGQSLGVTAEGYISQWGRGDRMGWFRPKIALEVRRLVPSPVYQSLTGANSESDPETIDVSADGAWAASTVKNGGLFVWNLQSAAPANWIPLEGVRSLCFHPKEPRLLITRMSGPESRSYTVVTNEHGGTLQLGEPVKLKGYTNRQLDLITISASGQSVAYVEPTGGKVYVEHLNSTGKTMRLQDATHSSVARQSSSLYGAGTISFSPDGRWLACGFAGPGLEIYDTRSGKLITRLTSRHGNVQFSPDGRALVLAQRDSCRMFRTDDWSPGWEIPCAPQFTIPASVAFSPDSKTLAVPKTAHTAALIDVETGRELVLLEAPSPSPIVAARWTPDGRRLVFSTRENRLDVWEPAPLQRELSALGLGWNTSLPGLAAITPALSPQAGKGPAAWIAAGAIITVGLVAVIAILSLRRHRTLIDDFARTEALAAQRERELEGEREVNRLKSNFVSMVSHEFRTPLAIIQSSAQILDRYLEKLPPEQRREEVGTITRNVRRITGLIDEVLLLGKVEAGQMRCTPAPLELDRFCHRLIDEMLSATDRRCPIELQIEGGELPPAQGDENLLRHMLGNLLSNAVKYSAPGQNVLLKVGRDKKNALFTIRDNGIGVPEAEQHKLFTAFHRASNVGQVRGTGLGLTIVKRCVELHGGEISFASAEGKGTTFTVSVPLFVSSRTRPL